MSLVLKLTFSRRQTSLRKNLKNHPVISCKLEESIKFLYKFNLFLYFKPVFNGLLIFRRFFQLIDTVFTTVG